MDRRSFLIGLASAIALSATPIPALIPQENYISPTANILIQNGIINPDFFPEIMSLDPSVTPLMALLKNIPETYLNNENKAWTVY